MTLRELLGSMVECIDSQADLATFKKFVGFVESKEQLDEVLQADAASGDESKPCEACQTRMHLMNVIFESIRSIAAADHLRFLARRTIDHTDRAKGDLFLRRVEVEYERRYETLIQRLNEAVDELIELEKAELAAELVDPARSLP